MPKRPGKRPRRSDTRLSATEIEAKVNFQPIGWQAGPTPVSELPVTDQVAHLGLIVTDAELRATERAIEAAGALESLQAISAPAAIDWRNNGGNWVTGIRDQQNCGSCVSFATVATVEARLQIACRNSSLKPDLAEAHVFYCGCGNCCGTGWNFPPALDFCKNTGVALESAFPYTPGNQPCKAGLSPYVKITNWSPLLSIADRKNVIASKGPVVAGMAVYQDFYSYVSGVYKHVTGPLRGYHAISVVGYDDNLKCWICKNSWGPGWGDAGFFRIAYGEAGIDTQFAFYDIDVKCPSDGNCDQYLPRLKSVVAAARTNRLLRLCVRHYVCGGPSIPPICPPAYRALAQHVALVLRRCPKYRAGFCRALA